jgi:hypothetical protein
VRPRLVKTFEIGDDGANVGQRNAQVHMQRESDKGQGKGEKSKFMTHSGTIFRTDQTRAGRASGIFQESTRGEVIKA